MKQHCLDVLANMNFLVCSLISSMVKSNVISISLITAFYIVHNNYARLSYGIFLLQEIVQRAPEQIKVHIMYDVACTFVQYLISRDSHLLEKVAFAIPSFHAYGHKPSCQVRHNYCFIVLIYI